ncbi:hypothetical protein BU23DRAFT_457605 [Bimuria novae-zelandiae CBS 107.79]|uniref:C2H2-type domain-containing protein n=1 Tax=Bimuria novae-zelandiae CBS 107.79 TaxID=1447943 RepID=A0A6A5VFA1_9PLEO|nr:hypothetical protein BU23DRAFT_457605 [Bimuria novae-zelandiae CBS 107.79]
MVVRHPKNRCEICDRRFTRPSALQTHMYSHTREKPFACDFEGCGRHFSFANNLRRHKKVDKEKTSPELAPIESATTSPQSPRRMVPARP